MTTGIKIRGSEVSITQNRISKVEVQLPVYGGSAVSHIQADQGFFFPAAENQTAGIKLQGVTYPSQRENFKSEVQNGIQLFWPTDQAWLKPDECYVACHFDPYQAAYGPSLLNYQSIPEMMTELRKPRAWYGNQSQINVHARFIRPLLDMSLLLIGLPLVIQRKEKNVFVASGLCFGLVAVFVLFVMASHALGQYSILQPAALAAWLPAIVFFPMAIVSTRSIDL
jgi:lipopolysaccharide export system permease protein